MAVSKGVPGFFTLLIVLVLLEIAWLGMQVLYYRDFPVFTTEEGIESMKAESFGLFADYL